MHMFGRFNTSIIRTIFSIHLKRWRGIPSTWKPGATRLSTVLRLPNTKTIINRQRSSRIVISRHNRRICQTFYRTRCLRRREKANQLQQAKHRDLVHRQLWCQDVYTKVVSELNNYGVTTLHVSVHFAWTSLGQAIVDEVDESVVPRLVQSLILRAAIQCVGDCLLWVVAESI